MKTWHVRGDPDSVGLNTRHQAEAHAHKLFAHEDYSTRHARVHWRLPVPLKRFIVFAGSYYYPVGGMEDYAGQADTLDEAKAFAKGLLAAEDWVSVFDTTTGELALYEEQP